MWYSGSEGAGSEASMWAVARFPLRALLHQTCWLQYATTARCLLSSIPDDKRHARSVLGCTLQRSSKRHLLPTAQPSRARTPNPYANVAKLNGERLPFWNKRLVHLKPCRGAATNCVVGPKWSINITTMQRKPKLERRMRASGWVSTACSHFWLYRELLTRYWRRPCTSFQRAVPSLKTKSCSESLTSWPSWWCLYDPNPQLAFCGPLSNSPYCSGIIFVILWRLHRISSRCQGSHARPPTRCASYWLHSSWLFLRMLPFWTTERF